MLCGLIFCFPDYYKDNDITLKIKLFKLVHHCTVKLQIIRAKDYRSL